jgi:hypothetical protein
MMLSLILMFIGADFPICTDAGKQFYPDVFYADDQYYVFWRDDRFDPTYQSLFGARVTATGTVLDPDGKELYKNQVSEGPDIAFDGTNLLAVFRNGC